MKHFKQKYKGKSFADVADAINNKYKDRDYNKISERSYNIEMQELARAQEIAQLKMKVSEQMKYGGQVPKYQTGGPTTRLTPIPADLNMKVPRNKPYSSLFYPTAYNQFQSGPFSSNMGGYQLTPQDAGQVAADRATLATGNFKETKNRSLPFDPFAIVQSSNINIQPRNRNSSLPFDPYGIVTTDNTTSQIMPSGKPSNTVTTSNKPTPSNPSGKGKETSITKEIARKIVAPLSKIESRNLDVTFPTEREINIRDEVAQRDALSQANADSKVSRNESAYLPAALGMGAQALINLGLLSTGADVNRPRYNPYEEDIKRKMAERGIDMTSVRNQILGNANAARENFSNARSVNVQRALESNLDATVGNQLSQSLMQQQMYNNQFGADYANVLNSLGQQRAQMDFQTDVINDQSKGAFENRLSAFGADIAEAGKFLTTAKVNKLNNQILADVLNNKYKDFGLNSDVIVDILNGRAPSDSLIQLKAAVRNNPELEPLVRTLEQYIQENG